MYQITTQRARDSDHCSDSGDTICGLISDIQQSRPSRQSEYGAPHVFLRSGHFRSGRIRCEFRLQPVAWRGWVSFFESIDQRVSFQPSLCEWILGNHASEGIMSYRCPNCVREKLVRARMAWFEYLSFFLLVRLWKCPHCFRHFWRPLL
jgi:hypothetical protein